MFCIQKVDFASNDKVMDVLMIAKDNLIIIHLHFVPPILVIINILFKLSNYFCS